MYAKMNTANRCTSFILNMCFILLPWLEDAAASGGSPACVRDSKRNVLSKSHTTLACTDDLTVLSFESEDNNEEDGVNYGET